jgi:hypothetical protein
VYLFELITPRSPVSTTAKARRTVAGAGEGKARSTSKSKPEDTESRTPDLADVEECHGKITVTLQALDVSRRADLPPG